MEIIAIPGCVTPIVIGRIMRGMIGPTPDRVGAANAINAAATRNRLPWLHNALRCRNAKYRR